MQPTKAQLEEMINDLPENIRKAITEFDWAGEVMNIGRAHQLQIDDIEVFRRQTLLVMLGQIPANTYEESLASKLHVSRDVASSLVEEANQRIFSELQHRAFRSKEPEVLSSSPSWEHSEDYLEPIEHEDLAGVMRGEGVELISHEHEKPHHHSDLSNEVSSILGAKMPTPPRKPIENNTGDDSPLPIRAVGFDTDEGPSRYQEPIEENDMKGIKRPVVDTKNLVEPGEAITGPRDLPSRDLGQKKFLDQSLDQHIMENPFLAKGDTLDVSPSEAETIREDKGFLNHLSQEKSE